MVTSHSLDRAKERFGLNREKARKIIERGMERGTSTSNLKSPHQKEWLERRSQYGCHALAYNGMCLIASNEEENCITVYELPGWFTKKNQTRYDKHNKRIRNRVKYQKMCQAV